MEYLWHCLASPLLGFIAKGKWSIAELGEAESWFHYLVLAYSLIAFSNLFIAWITLRESIRDYLLKVVSFWLMVVLFVYVLVAKYFGVDGLVYFVPLAAGSLVFCGVGFIVASAKNKVEFR